MKLIPDEINLDDYFAEQQVDRAKIRRGSDFIASVKDRFYGQGSSVNWIATGFDKMHGKFDLRPGELTVWAGINKHGKTTFLSNIMLNVMRTGQKVCIASMEMKPQDTMAKMTLQASGVAQPSIPYIEAFGHWTDDRLWIYDHQGRIAASRILALAVYVRKEMGIDDLVVDSLMKCGIGVDDLTGQKDFVDALSTIARDTGLRIHLVCHMRKGENEKAAPDKFSVKGAGEIADMPDNIVIVWKNLRKPEKPEDVAAAAEPDCFVRVAGQRHHPWEGSFAFWFDKGSQQYLEFERQRTSYIELELSEPAEEVC